MGISTHNILRIWPAVTLRLRSLREATKTDSKIIILDFRKARFSLCGPVWQHPMGNCLREQRGAGELADFQGQSPQSRRTVLSSVQEDKQAWQKASVGEHGAPVWAQMENSGWDIRWKQQYKDIACMCRNRVRKAKGQLEPKSPRENEKSKMRGVCISSKRKGKESVIEEKRSVSLHPPGHA